MRAPEKAYEILERHLGSALSEIEATFDAEEFSLVAGFIGVHAIDQFGLVAPVTTQMKEIGPQRYREAYGASIKKGATAGRATIEEAFEAAKRAVQ